MSDRGGRHDTDCTALTEQLRDRGGTWLQVKSGSLALGPQTAPGGSAARPTGRGGVCEPFREHLRDADSLGLQS